MKIGVFMLNRAGHGGAEKHAGQLVQALLATGHTSQLVASHNVLTNIDKMVGQGMPSISLEELADGNPIPQLDWQTILRRLAYDRIVLEKGHISQGTCAFHQAARKFSSGYIIIEQTTPPRLKEAVGHFPVLKIPRLGLWRLPTVWRYATNARYATGIVSVSDENRQVLCREFFYPCRRCGVIHNSVDTQRFIPSSDARMGFRKLHGLSPETFVFGSVGRLSQEKNIGDMIQAMAHLQAHSAPMASASKLFVFGRGEEEPGLRQLAVDLKVSEQVVFGGFTNQPEEVYPGFDMLLMSSLGEGLPLNLVESFACGCPGICTRVGGIPEVIASPDLGWLVEPRNPKALATAMLEAMRLTPEKRHAMSVKCRLHAEKKFNAEAQFGTYIKLIESGFWHKIA